MKTVGETLIDLLAAYEVDTVFGIPGVHTVELYRGLAKSAIRHITPRHEQGAGFMADGYARVSGKPGVCLVISGPGLTNTFTAMAQALEDSVPMLVISGVVSRRAMGHGRGALHELADQRGMAEKVSLFSHTLLHGEDLAELMARAFTVLGSGRPGPVHIEIPTDVMVERINPPPTPAPTVQAASANAGAIAQAARLCEIAKRPAIIIGGGARGSAAGIRKLAKKLGAPVVSTVNARGLLAKNPLSIPASPSLNAVRAMLADSDLVIALGTQLGPTDFDMVENGEFPVLNSLIRVDIDACQLARGQSATVPILGSVESAVSLLLNSISRIDPAIGASDRAQEARDTALRGCGRKMQSCIEILNTIRECLPGAIIVGDSTQATYAGNLYFEPDETGRWFNSSTGFGALGYAPPAAIGASIAAPDQPVVCLVGDGGFQFTLAEIGSAVDAKTPVIFLVWNNHGYQEIETFMRDSFIDPVGVKPGAPDFLLIAQAYGVPGERLEILDELPAALKRAAGLKTPALIELNETLLGDVD